MSPPCQQAAQQSLELQEDERQCWVGQVKAFQKNSREARAKWHAYCASHGSGVRDPLRHTAAFIKSFFQLEDQGMLPDQIPLHDMHLPSDASLAEDYRSVLEAKVQHGCRALIYNRDFQQKFGGKPLRCICAEALLRFVQAHEVARGKDPFAAPAKYRSPLAEVVKRMQSSRLGWKVQWDSYVEAAGHGVRDPSRHPAEFLDIFLTSVKPRCPKEWRTAALQLCGSSVSKQSTSSAVAWQECHVGSEDGDWGDSPLCMEVPSENDCATFSYSHPHCWPQQADVEVDAIQPIRTPLAMQKAAELDSQNVNMFLSQAEDADQGTCAIGQVVIGQYVDSEDGKWGDLHYSRMLPSRNESAMFSYTRRLRRWPQEADVGVDEMQPIRTPLRMPKPADPDSQNTCVNVFASQAGDANPGKCATGQAIRGRDIDFKDGNWYDLHAPTMVPSRNESGMFSHSRHPAISGRHDGSEHGDWEDPQYFAMVPSGNEYVMFSYSQHPRRWPQEADVGVVELQPGRTALALPKVADPDSQNTALHVFASQTDDATGRAIRGRHVGSEVGDWEDPPYSAMMSSGNECAMFSHSRPWPQHADVRVDDIQPICTNPLTMPKATDPDSQDTRSDIFASQAENAPGQAIRAFQKRRARPSSTPPLRSNTSKAVPYAPGVRVCNTFLEWQEPALGSL